MQSCIRIPSLARLVNPLVLALALASVVSFGGCGSSSEDGADTIDGGGTAEDGGGSDSWSACGGCPADEYCDTEARVCVRCLEHTHCGEGARCAGGLCLPVICSPGETTCEDQLERTCNELGTGWDERACAEGARCLDDACHDRLCEPGTTRCQGGLLMTCNETGFSEDAASCEPGELCSPGEGCVEVRHNLLFVVDTSGSMARAPESTSYVQWAEAWPACEVEDEEESRIGIARQLFRRILAERHEVFARSDFVLMRFPQRASGQFVDDLADPSDNACRNGLWQVVQGDTLSGDDDAHATGADETQADWFAENAWQTVLVPDPRAPGFASAGIEERKQAIARWMDGVEEAEPGDDATACTDADAFNVCGLERPCLGPEDGKTCHDITNPELRIDGGTPLGRTLFYAAEYLRRFVYVGGRPCDADADCASANYTCDDGLCVDELERCRKPVVVLLTDGVESALADEDDRFFAALVQAKRLHWGLGCESNDDCLNGATCGAGGTCTTAALEQLAAEDQPFADAMAYVDPDGFQRLEDGQGNAISVTVHIVDVAGGAEKNVRLATMGGGVIIRHSLYDLDSLISDLMDVFDIKFSAQCLGAGE